MRGNEGWKMAMTCHKGSVYTRLRQSILILSWSQHYITTDVLIILILPRWDLASICKRVKAAQAVKKSQNKTLAPGVTEEGFCSRLNPLWNQICFAFNVITPHGIHSRLKFHLHVYFDCFNRATHPLIELKSSKRYKWLQESSVNGTQCPQPDTIQSVIRHIWHLQPEARRQFVRLCGFNFVAGHKVQS